MIGMGTKPSYLGEYTSEEVGFYPISTFIKKQSSLETLRSMATKSRNDYHRKYNTH